MDYFGLSVSVSGDTAVIGAYNKNGSNRGAAYVFVRSGGVWTQQAELTAADGVANDCFGISVSVSGDTAVIGANCMTGYRAAAYVFVRSGGGWTQQAEWTASDGVALAYFGSTVSVSGDTTVIGAFGKNNLQGAAYVFVRSGVAWTQQAELTASDGAASDFFGYSVSVSGDTAVIGAREKNGGGAAYVFVRSGVGWTQQAELTASDGVRYDLFGWSVSVSGDAAVIGAYGKNNYQAAAYVFVRSGVAWTQQAELTASDGVANDYFGISVSVSGDTTVIGAPGKNTYRGAAYVFVRPRLGTDSLLVGSAGGTSSVVLAYNAPWTATANDSFLHISPGSFSGTGSGVVVFTYDPFTGTGTRTGTLTIAGLTLTVTQAGTDYVAVSPVVTLASTTPGFSAVTVGVDGAGNVYFMDYATGALKEWTASTQTVTTLVSTGLFEPEGLAVDSVGNAYIGDTGNNAVKKWSASSQQVTTLVSGLALPLNIAVDNLGNVYFADANNHAVKEWNASTLQVTTLATTGTDRPLGVAVDASGNVYFTQQDLHTLYEWNAQTQVVSALLSAGLSNPSGLVVDGSGNVYISDQGNAAVKKWSVLTQTATVVTSGFNTGGLALDGSGNLYMADYSNSLILEIPFAFVGPANLTEPSSAGSDSLLQVVPSTTSLTGVFAPTSNQSWLTIGTITNGVINFSFAANATASTRTAHITVLGQQITVTQAANVAPVVTTNPPSTVNLDVGDTATPTAAASGSPAPTVQWQLSTDGGATFNNIGGATSTTLTIGPAVAGQNGNEFRAVFTNASGSATTTA